MNLAAILSLVGFATRIKALLDVAATNEDVVAAIKSLITGPALSVLEQIGALLFPKVSPALHIAAAAAATYDPNVTKWVQGAANRLVEPSPKLAVDGVYGPLTRTAVEALQTKLGLSVDGWAGQATQAAIGIALTK